ncbi:DNA independent RNA polymerase I transcription factor [Arachnomyces sp. PD_36]|nr:DNA independent RNA polymerase I transcription factor [Arachnomyces sp. PD_36]
MVSLTPTSSASSLRATHSQTNNKNTPNSKSKSKGAIIASSSPAPPPSILKTSKSAIKSTSVANGNGNMAATAGQKRKLTDLELSSTASSSSSPPSSSVGSVDEAPRKKKARVTFEPEVEVRFLKDDEGDARKKDKKKNKKGDKGSANGKEGTKSTSVVREEVRRAIQRHVTAGEREAYDRVREVFLADPKEKGGDDGVREIELPTHETLRNHLLGLLSNVAALDRRCSELVNAVLGSEWLGRDESYVKVFVRFLGNLAAAQGGYLGPVLKMLVNGLGDGMFSFTSSEDGLIDLGVNVVCSTVPRAVGKLPGYPVVRTSDLYARTHMAIRHILRLIPAASGSLAPILSTNFPFDSDSVKANVAYTRNLITMMEYAPELQSDILALIMEKLVKIDVQIQIDMDDFEDEVGEDIIEDVTGPEYAGFGDEDKEDEEDDDDDSVISEDDMDAEAKRVKAVRENIRKLDCMIDIMFEYFNPAFTTGTINDKENALDLLLSHFESIILPTYRSRHCQFLLFHFSQTSPILIDRFATTCIEMLFNKRKSAITRQSAAAYLASFVARGAHVSPSVVRDVFDLLGTHLSNLRSEYEDSCRGPDLKSYSPFYSTAQALLYIFCFRWRDLTTSAMEEEEEEDDPTQPYNNNNSYHDLDLDDISFPSQIKEVLHQTIYSKLNPLKICSPAIVSEFARIAHHLRILYVYPLLESNKRIRVSNNPSYRSAAAADTRFSQAERETRAGGDGGYQLDAYFPFDPYHLPRSLRWLEGDYVEWRGVPGLDDRKGKDEDDDTDDSEEDEEEEEEEGDDDMDSDEDSG